MRVLAAKYVVYFRVSTKKQEVSGLGLEAQRTMAERHLRKDDAILAEFIEIESGKVSSRPQLAAAIALCRETGATLLIAKLDRLARNVLFIATLMESTVEFVCCDMPSANRTTIQLMAVLAEDEARRVSERTKAALAELKAQGKQLGSARPGHWDGREHLRGWAGVPAEKKRALKASKLRESYGSAIPLILALRERNESFERIAATLNSQGIKAPRGGRFRADRVREVVERLAAVA